MEIKFWGVRGSIPCPGPRTMKYGGNTSCLELRFNGLKRIIIIDAGSGIRELGNYLITNEFYQKPIAAEIFLTHTHWDHIHGFPFFAPIYLQDATFTIYGPAVFDDSTLEDAMAWQLTYRHFPIRLGELASKIEYVELKEDRFDLGDGITLFTKFLNHPVLCLGYRFEYNKKVLCTAYDTEPYKSNQQLHEFYKGADLLIHDAQYSHDEYKSSKIGWGHTSIEHAITEGKKANVKRLALFHHEPTRTDDQIEAFTKKYCSPDNTGNTEVFFAREGTCVQV